MIWVSFQMVASITVAANALNLGLSSNDAFRALAPFTIVRTRGILTIESDQVLAAESPQGIFGVIVVKQTAVDIGATAIPDSFNDGGEDFHVYQPFRIPTMRQTTNNLFTERSGQDWIIDSKAMRKVDDGGDIAFMCRNSSAAFGLVYSVTGRQLIKLH